VGIETRQGLRRSGNSWWLHRALFAWLHFCLASLLWALCFHETVQHGMPYANFRDGHVSSYSVYATIKT